MKSLVKVGVLLSLIPVLSGCPQVFDALTNNANPHSLTASRGRGTTITLGWLAPSFDKDDSTAVSNYEIFRDGSLLTTTSSTSYTDGSIVFAQNYSYRVRANLSKNGSPSTSDFSNTDNGWCVPAQNLLWGSSSSVTSTSALGWFETLVVKDWTYTLWTTSGSSVVTINSHDSPWNSSAFGTVTTSGVSWTSPRTEKVWMHSLGASVLSGKHQ